MTTELLIQHNDRLFLPVVLDPVILTTERKAAPGTLKFKVLDDGVLQVSEGDHVRFKVNGSNVFYGFIFKLQKDKDFTIDLTAYDQLRYLKNKDTYVYENKTAAEVIKMIADDFKMQTGVLDDTKYKIPTRVKENTSLVDIIQDALDMTLENEKQMYVMYDEFGKITLRNLDNMKLDILIDEETAQNYEYVSSIDSNTFNKIKLTYSNKKTGTRDVFIAQHGENINRWGVLQYFENIQEGENGKAKADALLELYNKKTRNLTIKNAFGDIRVRAGSMLPVILNLGDLQLKNYMLVEKCKHEFSNEQHTMDLTLRGGEFVA